LALGLRSDLDEHQWRVLRRTGTAHLVAISGLHVSLVAGLGFSLGRWLWSGFYRGLLVVPAQRNGGGSAVGFAVCYAALAGFSIPTQRAALMVTVVMAGLILGRRWAPSSLLAAALLVVLLLDPLAVLAIGFWMSFAAVAVIVFVVAGPAPTTSPSLYASIRQLLKIQMAVSFGLAPITLLFFHEQSLVSPLANMLAVWWVSTLVVPLVIFAVATGLLSSTLAGVIFTLATAAIEPIWRYLNWLAEFEFASIAAPIVSPWFAVSGVLGMLVLMMPRGLPGRWTAGLWFVPLLFVRSPTPAPGEFTLTVLDVGQGLSR
jgi:competence protein ComEC